ncbi:hypothetical protein, partial [Bradyrhizobium sp.]|uniref:hypothetical protein n=1 Tax=Bradyrhizobium sp. TaxID=376 RepID=UPI003D0D46C1
MVDRLPKSYLAGWIVAVILAFGPLFLDSHRDQYAIFLPGILSIITLVILDQWNSAEQRSKLTSQLMTEFSAMRQEIFSECQRGITGAQVVSTFSL